MARQGRKVELTTRGKHIVSFRVNKDEKTMIDHWARKNGLSTSSVLRAMFYSMQGSAEEIFSKFKEGELSSDLNRINQ